MGRGLERDSNWVGVVVVVEMVVGMAVSLFEKRPIFQVLVFYYYLVIFLESGFPFSTKYIPVPGTSTVLKTLVKFYLSSRLEPLLATTTKKD